jgi:hypothetical protein
VLPTSRWSFAAALCLAGTLVSGTCFALQVEVSPPRARNDRVWADIRLVEVISTRVEQSLARGMPATLELHAELWRRRSAWFDRLEDSYDASLKIRYEVWSRTYRLERKGAPAISLGSLDSVRIFLSRPLALPVGRMDRLQPGGRYFVAISVALKPLTVEDIEEGEGWLSGEVENKRGAGIGIITGIPLSVFDAVRNLAGFGDERARATSDEFEIEDLLGG